MQVPLSIKGLRVIFSGFHHFNREQAVLVIQDAVKARQGIAIFDGGDQNLLTAFAILLFQPVAFLIFTPFLRPFKFSRLFFTYLVPLIPVCTVWDGIVSICRLYNPHELLEIAKLSDQEDAYTCKAGKRRNKFGMHVAYLLGYPKQEDAG